jgi:hypothetical protein
MSALNPKMFSRIPSIVVVSFVSLPFFLIQGWEIVRFVALMALLMAYFLYLYYSAKEIEKTETSLDLISGIAGILVVLFAVVEFKIIDFEREVSLHTANVKDTYSWMILHLEDFDEFCIQCIQSRNVQQCKDYYRSAASRVKLNENPVVSGFNYDGHIEQCNRYKHFRLQMEQQIREEYHIGKSSQSLWKANLCDVPGLDGESKSVLCDKATTYDKYVRNRDDFIKSNTWYPAAMFVKSLKGLNWTLFLAIFAGLKAAKAISKFYPPALKA